jgi:16S rRNA (guanine527-N7)-methyltransferase
LTEDEAKRWVGERFGDQASKLLAEFAQMVEKEALRQNLVSASTLPSIWSRHIVDSAQLLQFATSRPEAWVDIGTGAGFPGMVTALLSGKPTILVEPRRRRVEFLKDAAERLGFSATISIIASKIETARVTAGTISARAVSPVSTVLEAAFHISHSDTLWILPKGRSAREEVAHAQRSWHGTFHVEQSITDPTSLIVIASGIARR